MKKISELNSKWYWRLIKVVYISLFSIILVWWVLIIIEEEWRHKLDINNTKVICYSPDDRLFLFPEKHKIFSLKDVWINELESSYSLRNNGFDYKNFITDSPYKSLQITIFCINENNKNEKDSEYKDIHAYNESWIDMFFYQKANELRYWVNKIVSSDNMTKEEEEIYISKMREYIDYVDNSYSNYSNASKLDFSIKMFDLNVKYLYSHFILYIIWLIIWVYFSFELIRRLTYYIILWSFFPKEKE